MTKRARGQSRQEIDDLRARLEEAEELLRAIQAGEVDALVTSGPDGARVYTLQGAERPYRILVESMQEGAVTLSTTGIVLYSNRRFAEILKLPLEQVLGNAIQTFVAPDAHSEFAVLLEQCRVTNCHGEITLRANDGTLIPAAAAFSTLPLDHISSIGLVITDLTEQKQTEEVARRLAAEQAARAEAEAAQRRFAFLTEVSTLLSASLDYEQIFANLVRLLIPRFADCYVLGLVDDTGNLRRVTAAAADPDVEAALHDLPIRSPGDAIGRMLQQVLESGKPLFVPEVSPEWFEVPFVGDAYPVLSQYAETTSFMLLPMRVRDQAVGIFCAGMITSGRRFTNNDLALGGEFARRLAQAIDNAHLYAASQSSEEILKQKVEARTSELQQALIRAESADQAKTTLLSTVTHEMRTPLSSIIGFSNLLLTRQTTPDKRQMYVTMVNAEARRLLTLVDDFLNLQRIESGRDVFHFSDVDLAVLVQDVASKQKLDEQDRHTLRLDTTPVPAVYADSSRIRQVLLNLLSNALKYSPDGGEITISLRHDDSRVIVSVQDHGLGIPEDELAHLFEHFHRGATAENLRIPGTGLGLALSRELIQAHHGQIWAESPGPDQGATFHFALPLATATRSRQQPLEHRGQSTKPGEAIVLIEDDPYFSAYLAERLELSHYRVQILSFDDATPEMVASYSPALVVLDILQSEKPIGWTTLTELKRHPVVQAIPILICSALQAAEHAHHLGASAFVSKPVDETLFLNEVTRLVNRRTGKVLIVEDDEVARRLLNEILIGAGYQTLVAEDGQAAIDLMRQDWPDLIVLDLKIPKVDGYAVLNWIRHEQHNLELPVIAWTGAELHPTDEQRIQQQATALAIKTRTSPQQLLDLIDHMSHPSTAPHS